MTDFVDSLGRLSETRFVALVFVLFVVFLFVTRIIHMILNVLSEKVTGIPVEEHGKRCGRCRGFVEEKDSGS